MLDRLLNRPVSVTMVLLVFVVLGFVGIGKLPVSLIPDVDIPYVTVQITEPDKSARELDDAVVKPLRQSLIQMEHLKDLKSESKDGSAAITLTFEEGHDIDFSYIEVNEKIDRAMSSLPKIDRPKVFKASAADIPAFYVCVTMKDGDGRTTASDASLFPVTEDFRRMSDFVTNVLKRRIEQLPEVAMVDMTGTVGSEILVIPDEDALRRVGLSLGDFEMYISSANVSLSNLTIRDGEYHYNVKFQSFASSAEDIAGVYFKAGDRVLQIRDVAEVMEHPATRSGLAVSDGRDAVIMAVIKQSEARMSDLKKAISEQMDLYGEEYPELEFTVTRDQTELLEYSINNLLWNIILAILLDCIIIFLFMKDLRTPFLVAFTIPVSLIISFFVFYVTGLTINIISLSGLILGVGMMVDNTIVLTDNITARWNRGESLRTAVVEGTKEVSGAMLSSVLTTCAVFIPLVFLNGLAGELFFDQAVAVTVVLLVSYLVTVIVIPVYYWALYRKLPSFQPNRFLSKIELKHATEWYDRTVSWFLGHLWTAWAVPLFCAAVIALCALFMPKEKLPPITYTDAVLNVNWNEHVSLDVNKSRTLVLEDAVSDLCIQTSAMVGVQQFVLSHSGDQSLSEASIYLKCRNARDLEKAERLLGGMLADGYPSAVIGFANSGNIFDMVFSEKEPQLLVRLRPTGNAGMLVEDLQQTLADVREALPEVPFEAVPLKTDVLYVSDPEMMALYGITFADLTSVLANSLNGNELFEIVQGDRSVPVVLGTDVRDMESIFSDTFIQTSTNGSAVDIPVSAVMRQTWERDFKTLVAGEEGDYYPLALDVRASKVKDTMKAVSDAVRKSGKFDAGYSGAYFTNMDMIRQMVVILLLAIALLFLILASQFESLIQPVIILSEVVIDIAVSLAALWALGVSINLMSLIGLVVICGIVINDSILKIDTINRLRKSGMAISDAVHEAGHRRLKAIIMTSVTTILSVAPFLSRGSMGNDLQYPMALVIIIGMIVGTLVSLFFVPAVYAAIYRHKN